MLRDFRVRIFSAYVSVLVLGAVLAGLVYFHAEQVSVATQTLSGHRIPELKAIAGLRVDVARQASALARLVATGDHPGFLAHYQTLDAACEAGLHQLAGPLAGRDELKRARAHYETLRQNARELDQTMRARAPNVIRARSLLVAAQAAALSIERELDRLAASVDDRIDVSVDANLTAVANMRTRVVALATAIFIISLLVGFGMHAYIREQTARRRLAMFPERNPNPVLQLDADGTVRYANPSAAAMLTALALAPDQPEELLPPDHGERFAALRAGGEQSAAWEYTRHDHVYECRAHWIADLRVFHAYIRDITARKRAEEDLVHQAYHDALTGLPNRRMFNEQIGGILYGPHRAAARSAVLLLGVDRMKVIIDSLGHGIGDGLLRALATRLTDTLQQIADDSEGAQLYRFDGNLFCVLLPSFAAAEIPVLLAERLIEATREPFYVDRRELHTSLSIGISVYPLDGQDGAVLLKNADTAMHRARANGGNSLQCYTRDMNDRAAEWLALENHLRHAAELGELTLHYQPQVDIASGRVVGVESLLRWQHPTRGDISPGVFIPLAEETGLIDSLGDWVLHTACRQGCTWLDQGIGPITVAINLSARQLHAPDLGRRIGAALADTGLPPELLEIEITESVAMHDTEATIETLRTLRQLNVRLSVDDFGTGFSSLSYLRRFPIDKLKIDQSFVRHLVSNDNDAAIAQAIISIGHSLRLTVIAEGVTDSEQLARLRDWRCDQYQGYLYSGPLPAADIDRLLRATATRH